MSRSDRLIEANQFGGQNDPQLKPQSLSQSLTPTLNPTCSSCEPEHAISPDL